MTNFELVKRNVPDYFVQTSFVNKFKANPISLREHGTSLILVAGDCQAMLTARLGSSADLSHVRDRA